MRFSTVFALAVSAPLALAQSNTTTNTTGLISALRSQGLTTLASFLAPLANASEAQMVFMEAMGGPATLFAPDNAAIRRAMANLTGASNSSLAALFSYHLASGSYPNASSFAMSPNHTIVRTFLNDTQFVQLEGNRSQVLVTEKSSNNTVTILRQPMNVTVSNTTMYGNLTIHAINSVLYPPGSIMAVAPMYNFAGVVTALQSTPLASSVTSARGITIFAPSDSAFTAAVAQLGQAASNLTLLSTILGNHIINGTTAYSTQLGSGSYTSASGQAFQFMMNSTGTFVTSGNSSAQVVQADIPVSNGVVHVINGVLANMQTNPGAASSAYQAATSSAAQMTSTMPGPVGSATASASGSSGTTSAQSAAAINIPALSLVSSAFMVLVGAFLTF